ncbi:MAG: hypothetical protein ABH820_00050 [Patescibacteria group bacterium]|nr:hypothetical protein [Patescibacteria group bacterium]
MKNTTFTIDQVAELRRLEKSRMSEGRSGLRGEVQDLITAVKTGDVGSPGESETPSADLYANEQVTSKYGYVDWQGPKPVQEQAHDLVERISDLDISHVDELAERYYESDVSEEHVGGYRDAAENGRSLVLSEGMDGLVVIPKMSAVARLEQRHKDWPDFNRAMFYLLGVMKAARSDFYDYTGGKVGPNRLRLHEPTVKVIQKLEADIPGDVLVIPVQTGLLHRGKSPRRARVRFQFNEFGLDSFSVGCILLTHPDRLKDSKGLWIDCPGAEFAPTAGSDFSPVPCWLWHDGELGFHWFWHDSVHECYGSASARLPE